MDQVNKNKMESDQNNQRMKAKERRKNRHETSSLIFDGPAPNCPHAEGGFFSKNNIGTFREHKNKKTDN
jgi:hypothetical protein